MSELTWRALAIVVTRRHSKAHDEPREAGDPKDWVVDVQTLPARNKGPNDPQVIAQAGEVWRRWERIPGRFKLEIVT